MADSTITATAFNEPYGIDQTSQRIWLRGKFAIAAGNWVTGGLLPNWQAILDASGQAVLLPTYSQPTALNITNSALTSNVATLTAANSLVVGQYVTFSGLTNLPFLNGKTLIVASRNSTTFTVAFTHANVGSAAENGTAVLVIGPDDLVVHSVAASGYIYEYVKSTGTIVALQSADQTVPGAGPLVQPTGGAATPDGITGDTIHFTASWAKQ